MMYRTIIYYICILLVLNTSTIIAPCYSQEINQPVESLAELVPESYGTIRDSHFAGANSGIIVHIQDLHCNYDAQMSIYHIIDELIDKYGLEFVAMEGSIGKLDTSHFARGYDKNVREIVGKQFLRLGRISGPSFAHIMREGDFSFWGVDEPKAYDQNVEAFKTSLKSKNVNNVFYKNMRSIINNFKSKIYSKELKELDDKIDAYKEEEIDFAEYIDYIKALIASKSIDMNRYPNFKKLIDVLSKESDIDFLEVDNQRLGYIEKLNDILKDKELSGLLDKSLHFKTGKLSAVAFYTYLKAVSEKENAPDMEKDFSQLYKYIDYLVLYSDINNTELFKELDNIEKALKDKIFRNDIERKVDKFSYNLGILKDLFNIKLTKEALQYYRDNRKEFTASHFINFISENAPRYKIRYKLNPVFRKVDSKLPDIEKFYNLAEERDNALVFNTLNKMREKNAKMAVLVSGGFHTEGITKLLKDKNISYIVVTPKVDKLQDDNPYVNRITGQKDEVDLLSELMFGKQDK